MAVDVFGDRQIMVARELTKMHEEILRGSTAHVLASLSEPRGEFTVVLSPTNSAAAAAIGQYPDFDDTTARLEFSQLTEKLPRRQAITILARKYGLPSREVYQRLEASKDPG